MQKLFSIEQSKVINIYVKQQFRKEISIRVESLGKVLAQCTNTPSVLKYIKNRKENNTKKYQWFDFTLCWFCLSCFKAIEEFRRALRASTTSLVQAEIESEQFQSQLNLNGN